jgi:hypothetical protein
VKYLPLALVASHALSLCLLGCEREDDLPPPIPVAAAPAATAPAAEPRGAQPTPPVGEPPAPPPGQPQPASPGATPPGATPPGATPPASTGTPAMTPFQIPWFPLPTAFPSTLPQIPGLPALPALPGLGVPGVPTAPPAAPGKPGTPSAPAAPAPQAVARVVVYGTKWCGPCKSLKADLTRRGVPYEWVDVEDPKAPGTPAGQRANEIPASMRGAVPVTRVTQRSGQVVWVRGADGARIEQAYRA